MVINAQRRGGKRIRRPTVNLSKVPASFAHLERQGRLLPDGRRGGELLQLCNLMLSFSIKVKDTWKLKVHKMLEFIAVSETAA